MPSERENILFFERHVSIHRFNFLRQNIKMFINAPTHADIK